MYRFLTFCLFSSFLFPTFAQTPWTANDIVHQESLSEAVFSPNGDKIAWTKRRASDKKDKFVTDLYLSRKSGTQWASVQLTRTEDSDRNPVFSAGGDTLYFLSSRSSGKSLWAINLLGGEAWEVDSFPGGISQLARVNDSTLAFTGTEGKTLYERQLKEKKDDVEVVEDSVHQDVDRLFFYNLIHNRVQRVTKNIHPLDEYDVSPDGQWAVTSHTLAPHYPADGKPRPKYFLWNLKSGEQVEIFTANLQNPREYQFVASGAGFFFTATQSSDPEWEGSGIKLLYFFDLETKTYTQIDLQWANGMSSSLRVGGDRALMTLADGAYVRLAVVEQEKNIWKRTFVNCWQYDRHLEIDNISEDGQQAFLTWSTASVMPQYLAVNLKKEGNGIELNQAAPIGTFNESLRKKTTAKSEVITWTGAMDEEVNGILFYPHNYQPGRTYPLIVAIHGGPSGVDIDRWSDRWAYPLQLLAQEGAFILQPNYHGSSNHGQAFVESIKGHYYEYELPDILAGIEYLAEKGLITEDSLGVMGWSNGAILTTMLTVQHPGLFKAASAGAGDVNWSSDFGTCEFGVTFDQSYFGGAPWDDTDGQPFNPNYILKSPLFELEKVQTPTLIHHGSEDRAVPRDQGWEYYRALQQVGKAPVRFLWYPDQPHGLGKISHQKRKMEEEIRWFRQYLFGKDVTESEVIKKGSPLAIAREVAKASQVNGLFGVQQGRNLIPETRAIAKDSIAVGVFEVTNAQYAAFIRNYSYAPDKGNHPVTGINIQQAAAYCKWLYNVTGDQYRLPTKREAQAWTETAQSAADDENTLNYWAGYELTLDEAEALLSELEGEGPRSTRAGSFAPVKLGEAVVFDLGGNVSEWYTDGDTTGNLGYGFLDLVDNANLNSSRNPQSMGFRVVKDQ